MNLPVYGNRLTAEPPPRFPAAMINITNRCNLECIHCFVYRDGNPNDMDDQIPDDELLERIEQLRDRHGLYAVVWMGGEPMIRWKLVERGVKLFSKNTIATNGTIPLRDFGANVTYVVSLDGPPDINDEIRGAGVYEKARANIQSLPDEFAPTVQVQCVVTKTNQHRLHELVEDFIDTKADGMTFSFLCPAEGETSELAWADTEEREAAVDIVIDLKRRYPKFIWNRIRALELMRPATAKLVTDNCPAVRTVLPLYVEDGQFVTPKCCHGNNVDCDRCGAWVVFAHASQIEGPWDDIVPTDRPPGILNAFLAHADPSQP